MKKKIFSLVVALMAIALGAQAQNSINGHEFVDLGLDSGTLWATMNVGATTSSEQGTYYTAVPTHTWGDAWRFPTKEQFNELISSCTIVRHEEGSTIYYVLTSKINSKTITIPGSKWDSSYWVGYLFISGENGGDRASGYEDGSTDFDGYNEYNGFNVRLVSALKTISGIPDWWKVNGVGANGGKVKVVPTAPVTVTPANLPVGKKVKSIKLVPVE